MRRSTSRSPENPRGIALGDFNRDGILDIIVTKYAGTTLDILYGAGNGTFPTRRTLAAPTASQGVAVRRLQQRRLGSTPAVASNNGHVRDLFDDRHRRHALRRPSDRRRVERDQPPWTSMATAASDVVVASSASNLVSGMYNFRLWLGRDSTRCRSGGVAARHCRRRPQRGRASRCRRRRPQPPAWSAVCHAGRLRLLIPPTDFPAGAGLARRCRGRRGPRRPARISSPPTNSAIP